MQYAIDNWGIVSVGFLFSNFLSLFTVSSLGLETF